MNRNERIEKRKFYLGFMVVFWIIWVPITFVVILSTIDNFSFFWVIWLPFGIAGTILIPIALYGTNGSHIITAESGGPKIYTEKDLFFKNTFIKRGNLESVMVGYVEDGDGESVATLNV